MSVDILYLQNEITKAEERKRKGEELKDTAKRESEEARKIAEEAKRGLQAVKEQAATIIKEAEEATRQAEYARREAEEHLERGIPPEFQPTEEDKRHFRKQYGIQVDKINIAITGASGTGKSSFINALRGLSPGDPGAASAGFDETTEVIQGYADPRHPNIVWYDVPGANTPRIRGWTYFTHQGLFVFDVIVVLFCDRFTETVGTLISNANKCSIPSFLIRTKADQLIRNMRDDAPSSMSDEAVRELVIKNTRKMAGVNLRRLQLPDQRVYIVSKEAMKKWVVAHELSASSVDEMEFLQDILPPTDAVLTVTTRVP
ncbi:hypothetical protein CVT24_011386 [Panaeolus cyanescens]|uniref:IRG-type G domain-containing protein n=1 Tax=Panaeolus cyanescens TaxID=181874 RepID=A0A409VG20_9AGAR|nr:hypothetical protein CVT24_011386 [Panaeolus cyanescens]